MSYTDNRDDKLVCEIKSNDNYVENNLNDSDSDEDNGDVLFQDLQLFFYAINEPQLIDKFIKQKVTLGQLMEFNEQDLIDCGVDLVGDRKKILASTGQMHCETWSPSSLQDLTVKTMLSSPGIYIALNDINKHLEYIGLTFKYIRRRIQNNPQLLELGKDYVGVNKVTSELNDLMNTSKSTYLQLKALKSQVVKYSSDTKMKPANHIDETYLKNAILRKKAIPILLSTICVIMALGILKKVQQ